MIKLPRLPLHWRDQPQLFERYWDEVLRSIENNISSIASGGEGTSLLVSFVKPSSSPIIRSDWTGKIAISNHTRIYGDGSQVLVTGGTIMTNKAPGSLVRVYYLDSNKSGGTVGYQYTTDPQDRPVQAGNVHVVGVVAVPPSGYADGLALHHPSNASL